ncbi:MAG: hypothetical protein ABIO81_03195 [Ginsengibacter sp.]
MKFLFLFFLVPLKIFGQDVTGVWTGTLYSDTTKQFIKYELAISEDNGKLSGYSHTIFIIDSVENIGVKSIKIKKSGEEFFLEDDKLIYNNYSAPPAKRVKTFSELILSQKDTVMTLTGPWNTNQTKTFTKLTGKIFLQKKKEILQTLIVPKLDSLGLTRSLSFAIPKIQSKYSSDSDKPKIHSVKLGGQQIENEKDVVSNVSEQVKPESHQFDKKRKVTKQSSEEVLNNTESILNKATSEENTTARPQQSLQKNKVSNIASRNIKSVETKKPGINKISNGTDGLNKNETTKNKKNKEIKMSSGLIEKPASKKEVANIFTTKENTEQPIIQPGSSADTINENIIKKNSNGDLSKVAKTILQPAAEISIRKIETIKSVEIKQDSLVFSLFDNGEIDGDTVSVLLNGKVIMPRQGLMSRAINKTIYLTPEMGDSVVLIMYAENLGTIPPNTGLLVIHDGNDIFEIRFTGDLQKNSAIILRRKRKQ